MPRAGNPTDKGRVETKEFFLRKKTPPTNKSVEYIFVYYPLILLLCQFLFKPFAEHILAAEKVFFDFSQRNPDADFLNFGLNRKKDFILRRILFTAAR